MGGVTESESVRASFARIAAAFERIATAFERVAAKHGDMSHYAHFTLEERAYVEGKRTDLPPERPGGPSRAELSDAIATNNTALRQINALRDRRG